MSGRIRVYHGARTCVSLQRMERCVEPTDKQRGSGSLLGESRQRYWQNSVGCLKCVAESRCGNSMQLRRIRTRTVRQAWACTNRHTHKQWTAKGREKDRHYSLHVWKWVRVVMSIFKEVQRRVVICWYHFLKVETKFLRRWCFNSATRRSSWI